MKYPWKQKILESKKIELLLVALLLAAIVIRAYHFGAPPIGVHQDEAMAAVDAKALADYGTDRYGMRYPVHFTAWVSSQMSVLLSYCMIPFIKLLGFSTVSTRLPMLVISCLGLLALYLFGRQLAGKWTGMIVLILGTISPWHYMQSRWSFDCNLFPHVFLIAVVLLIAGLKKKPLLYLSMVMFGLCSYAYGIADYSVPLFLLVVAIYLLRQQAVNWKELAACFVLYLVIVLPEFLSMLLTLLEKPGIETPLFTIPSFLSSNRGDDILFANFSWKQLWENIVWTFTTTWGSGDKSVTNTMVRFGPVYYITDLFFVIGLVSILRQGQNDVLAVCQALTGQVLALVLRAGNIQVQLGNGGTGGVVHGVLSGLDSGLRACSLGRSSNRGSHGRGGGRSSGRGRGRTAGGHADGQCQSSSDDSSIFQFHSDRFSLFNVKSSFMGQLRVKVAHE